MARNYTRKDPGVWNHEPFEILPNRPSRQAITVLHDEDGHPYVIDAELDHLFIRRKDYSDEVYTVRRVWTEADGTIWTEIYDSGHNSPQEQKARAMPLAQFVWETWNVNPLPGKSSFVHNNGDHRDYRICNLTRIRK